jgi:phosphoglycolate phosphatase
MIVGAMQRAITAIKLPARTDESIRELIGLGLNEALGQLYPEIELPHLHQLLSSYRAQWLSEGAGEAALFPGTLEAMQNLHESGYQIAIATGKSRKGLDRSLRHHNDLRQWVLASRTADETASKPNPLMLQELLAELDIKAQDALMIGDTEYDMAMARAIGMPGLGVTCGVHAPQRMLDAGAGALIESVRDLPGWLKK